mgnify:FL=1
MPRARASDGTALYWEEVGAGRDVVLVPYWSLHPTVFGPVTAELARDHRVIRYDERGTGAADRTGPYDLETAAGDLEAVAEVAGLERAVAICLVDASHRAVRVASRRPELIEHVVCLGGGPLTRDMFAGTDSLVGSSSVVGALMRMVGTDYRGAMRSLLEATNPQMDTDELRERVRLQAEHVPREAALERLLAWASDEEAVEAGRKLGARLAILTGDDVGGGGWFPGPDVMEPILAEHFPEARFARIAKGLVSAPELTAGFVRGLAPAAG